MARDLLIGARRLADDEPCYVIAELGHNHGGSAETARIMIRAAASAGVSAVKLQKRTNATLYTAAMRKRPYENDYSYGPTYGAHRDALELDWSAYRACQQEADASGVQLFATAFDEQSADFLMVLELPAIKIHSGGLTDRALLKHVAGLEVPIILSTGGGDARDIDAAVQTITARHDRFALLHCTAAYPVTDYAQHNLRCIWTLRERYPDTVIGWSGHDSGIAMGLVAYAFGAAIIEQHFTLNRAGRGTDHRWSLEPVGMRKLCRDLGRAREAIGDGVKRMYESERKPLSKMRRALIHGRWQIGTETEQANLGETT